MSFIVTLESHVHPFATYAGAVAEIRKHKPTTSDIGEQVRALVGDDVRPVEPGAPEDEDMYDPFVADDEPEDDEDEPVTAGGGPLIGDLPEGFNLVIFDD